AQFGAGSLADLYTVFDFQFQDANHTHLSSVDVAKRTVHDELASGNHTVLGTQYSDTFDAGQGAGGFYMSGGPGGDTYVFGEGYGHDTIFTAHYPLWSPDVVLFNADVDPSEVRFGRGANPDDLTITLADGSELDIRSEFGGLGWVYNIATF